MMTFAAAPEVPETETFVSHLECSATGERLEPDRLHNLSAAGKPILVRYDLARLKRSFDPAILEKRAPNFWRYRELLPIRKRASVIALGETMTPLLPCPRLGRRLKSAPPLIKDEGRLPTGSFKARGLALAVAMAHEFGVKRMAMPSNGNAGAALAAYAAAVGIEAYVFCPADTPEINLNEIAMLGAKVFRVNGLIDDCGRIVAGGVKEMGWFDTSTLKEPYRIEGKKTMGLELAEQLGWTLPDAIFYPTGGGTGLIGMWKAFQELEAIGLIKRPFPKMIAVQATGCAPIVRAYDAGVETAERWENASTIAAGIRVPRALGDFLILRAVRESGGWATAVSDGAILAARAEVAADEGMLLCPEGAATYAAYRLALAEGKISRDARVVLFNCATGLKYPMPPVTRSIDRNKPIDYAGMI
jgi:threonine synthase